MKKALLLFALVAISAVSINAQDNLKWGVVAGMNVNTPLQVLIAG